MSGINPEGRSSTPGVDIRHVDTAFDSEARQAQQDWLDYLKQRPYLDDEGNIRDPETNAIISVNTIDDGNRTYYDRVARETLDETSRESYSLMDLAYAARAAKLDQDRTKFNDILDEIADRMVRMKEKYGWSPEVADGHREKIMSMIHDKQDTPTTPEDSAPTSSSSPKLRSMRAVEGDNSRSESRGGRDFSPLEAMDYQHIMAARSQEGNLRFYLRRDGIQSATDVSETTTRSISAQEKRSGSIFDDPENQDAVAVYPGVIGVFDGVGSGAHSGAVSKRAARLTETLAIDREPFKRSTIPHEAITMERFFKEAGEVLRDEFDHEISTTTGVIARTFINEQDNTPMVCVGHLGDSRAYIRSADGVVKQLTNDHGYMNIISTHMTSGDVPDIVIAPIAKGDILLLVSDGITGDTGSDLLSEADIAKTITDVENKHGGATLDEITEALMKRSTKSDDTSVVAQRFV